MLVIMVMAVFVVAFDLNRINMTMNAWVYSDEAKAAPSHHGLSGFPPRDITSKYMSVRAQNYLNVTKPNTWSTVSGMWRVETDDGYVSDLCLQPGGSSNANDIAGKSAKITQCTRDSQWLHGSDKKYFFDEEQMLLSKQVRTKTIVKQRRSSHHQTPSSASLACSLAGGPSTLSQEHSNATNRLPAQNLSRLAAPIKQNSLGGLTTGSASRLRYRILLLRLLFNLVAAP